MRKSTKKIMCFMLSASLVLANGSMPVSVKAAGTSSKGTISRETSVKAVTEETDTSTLVTEADSTGAVVITEYTGSAGVVDLTTLLEGQNVISIAKSAFYRNENITKVIIPSTIENIGEKAFSGCSALKEVVFGSETSDSALTTIGDSAFYGTALTMIEIPETVESIGQQAFRGCSTLAEIKFGNSLISIGSRAFSGSGLTSVVLPDSVETVGEQAFRECESLTGMTWSAAAKTVPELAFEDCVALNQVTIPEGCTAIGDSAFKYCEKLTEITLPETCTTIGADAFGYCTMLAAVNIPGCTNIGEKAFYSDTALADITIPEACTTVNSDAFGSCTNLNEISFKNYNTNMLADAFPTATKAENLVFYAEPEGNVEEYARNNSIRFARYTDSLEVTAQPLKKKYLYGETLDTAGLEVVADFTSDTEPASDVIDLADGFITGFNSKKTGKQTITVAYGGVKTSFAVNVYYDMSEAYLYSAIPNQTYTGYEIVPDFTMYGPQAQTTISKEKYSVEWQENCTDVGTVTATLTATEPAIGGGYYKGTTEISFNIVEKNIADEDIEISVSDQTYTGSVIKPVPAVTYGAIALEEGKDFKVSYSEDYNVSVGTGYVYIEGIGNYTGYQTIEFDILPKDISEVMIEELQNVTYNGSEQTPSISLKLDEYTSLSEGWDYTIKYKNNTSAGTGTALITGMGNYTGTVEKDFIIEPKSILDATVSDILEQIYSGLPICPSVNVSMGYYEEIVPDVDYRIEYENNIATGQAIVKVIGQGNYKDTIIKNFDIVLPSIEDANIIVPSYVTYTGEEQIPTVAVTLDGKTLTAGVDYITTVSDNINVGSATVTVEGIGMYRGTAQTYFYIQAKSIYSIEVNGLEESYEHTGSAITPQITVTMDDAILYEGVDYLVTYMNNTKVGEATLQITGIGNYGGDYTTYFDIVTDGENGNEGGENTPEPSASTSPEPTASSSASTLPEPSASTLPELFPSGSAAPSVNPAASQTPVPTNPTANKITIGDINVRVEEEVQFEGETPEIEVEVEVSGELLEEKVDYTLAFEDMDKPGIGKITVTGIGAYQGIVTKSIRILPEQVKLSSVKAKKGKKIAVKWKKTTGATGYEVSVALNKKFAKGKKAKNTKAASYTFKKLSKKKYYVRVRAYVSVGGEKVYGDYSTVKSAKVKK